MMSTTRSSNAPQVLRTPRVAVPYLIFQINPTILLFESCLLTIRRLTHKIPNDAVILKTVAYQNVGVAQRW